MKMVGRTDNEAYVVSTVEFHKVGLYLLEAGLFYFYSRTLVFSVSCLVFRVSLKWIEKILGGF
jgi:hypothetical protein